MGDDVPQDSRATRIAIWSLAAILVPVALYVLSAAVSLWLSAAGSAWYGLRAPADRGLALQYVGVALAPAIGGAIAWLLWRKHRVVRWIWALAAGALVGLVVLVPAVVL